MSFLDKAKQAFGTAKDKAGELANEHGDKIDSAIDKGGSFIDQKTHGKYADKVAKAGSTAKNAADKLAAQNEAGTAAPTSEARPDPEAPTAAADPTEAAGPIPAPEPVDPPEPIRPQDPGAPGTPRP
jgi:uncharacterized protein YjbJ (UPF0337 family)